MLIYVHDICPFPELDNGPFTKCNNKINPLVESEQESKGQCLALQTLEAQ